MIETYVTNPEELKAQFTGDHLSWVTENLIDHVNEGYQIHNFVVVLKNNDLVIIKREHFGNFIKLPEPIMFKAGTKFTIGKPIWIVQ